MIKFSIIFLVLFLVACPQVPLDGSNNPAACVAAEAHLHALKCIPDGNYTKTMTFTQFCAFEISQNITMYPKCLAAITDCGETNKCLQDESGEKQ